MNRWTDKMIHALPCPFCGSTSVNAIHKQNTYLGSNGYYVVKIGMSCYCKCNKCHARSKPIKYIGYFNAPFDFYDDEHPNGYSDKYKLLALNEWNKRG